MKNHINIYECKKCSTKFQNCLSKENFEDSKFYHRCSLLVYNKLLKEKTEEAYKLQN